ncbi:hypothetical protein Rsub_06078 [Raphidocelis subcapitata]|uniref:Mitochondrial import inner membrane translocase subunit TIM50 n=1 Tax=Raphidocelis subcapitata TaxID=307507 RepID=A0A2V0P1K1_9CHLO|nr:hypothetical protein Rsub_06078 [Raphidocelis subcapitata]|eukprot:GBF93746.1 hypothetical protein Rsub_06078 [Raphidocelis subcapitata]
MEASCRSPSATAVQHTAAALALCEACVAALTLLWAALRAAGSYALLLLATRAAHHIAGVRDHAATLAAAAAALLPASPSSPRLRLRRAASEPLPATPPAGPAPGRRSSGGGLDAAAAWCRRLSWPGPASAADPAAVPLAARPQAEPAPLLPPQLPQHAGRLAVVLDLDETLLYPRRAPQTQHQQPQQQADVLRPGVHEFLAALSECAEVLLWTAGGAAYAQRQLQALDPHRKIFAGVVAGAASTGPGGAKDLARLNRCLARTVLVDNSVASFAAQPLNGVPIPPFTGDPGDRVLLTVILPLLQSLAQYRGDIRPILSETVGLGEWMRARSERRRTSAAASGVRGV